MSLKTKEKTRLANSMAMLTSVCITISTVLLKSLGASNTVLMITSGAAVMYWVPILLNFLGVHVVARLVQVVFSNVLIFVMILLFDHAACFEYYYMVMIGLPLIFFSDEIGKWKWVLAGSTLPLWASAVFIADKVDPYVYLEPSIVFALQIMNNALQFLFLAAMFYFFSKMTKEHVAKLERQKLELQDANMELDEALLKANEATETKSMFLANMSHEIRTPLNGVILASYMLRKLEMEKKHRDLTKVIWDSGNNLLAIVDDILDFSKIEANKMIIDLEPFDLKHTVQQVLTPLELECDKKGIGLKLVYDNKIPDVLVGDRHRLRQVLTNLVGNAVKFTTKGEVIVRVHSNPSHKSDHVFVDFSVEDTGKGIPADKLESIFESFTQEDGSTSRSFGGTGLGTTISKMLVELMGGKIYVKSPNPNGSDDNQPGSIFNFFLEMEISSSDIILPEHQEVLKRREFDKNDLPETTVAQSSNIKILVAEDNLINQKVATMLFEKLGYSIEIVENGQEAVRRTEEVGFDVIFMDYMMPLMDGLEATRILRSKNNQTPIIAMTANARERDKKKCMEAGMNDYVSKPVAVEKLQAVLEKWLAKKENIRTE